MHTSHKVSPNSLRKIISFAKSAPYLRSCSRQFIPSHETPPTPANQSIKITTFQTPSRDREATPNIDDTSIVTSRVRSKI